MGYIEGSIWKLASFLTLENARGKKFLRAENFISVFLLNRPQKREKTPYFAFLTTRKGLKWHFKFFTPKSTPKTSFSHFNTFSVVKTRKEWSKSILWPRKPQRLKNIFQDWMETRRATGKINFKNPKSKVGVHGFWGKMAFLT